MSSTIGFGAGITSDNGGGGRGNKLGRAVIIVAGVASLIASILSFMSIWFQLRNYRKPLLQRYVVRILLMVPIYSAASWASLISLRVAFYVDPLRDIYEAFTIYTFFQLLINFLGGERSLIIMMHGRAPVHHPWPLNHFLSKVDISDPHTFLAVKRGILQYAWLKPVLGVATIVMKATDTYKEGYLGVTSGYLWLGIIYNVSVSLSLYALAMFWICMSDDLKPFRPVPKFLNIKLIIFASYWQGFFLSILQFLGAIPSDVAGYTADNLAAAIQDALICIEMPLFAIGHWYAFSWHDYADATISAARMPMRYAFRDAFGVKDLIHDTKATFQGERYEYRAFDARDNIITHEESESRTARMLAGMRYSRNGKGKYWLPEPGKGANVKTPLLGNRGPITDGSAQHSQYQATSDASSDDDELHFEDPTAEEDELYEKAKLLEFVDWNYPVITAHIPSKDLWYRKDPSVLTTSTNRNLLQPTKHRRKRREKQVRDKLSKGKQNQDATGSSPQERAPVVSDLIRGDSSTSTQSGRSQLVDLVVEDEQAEAEERVRARKEGSSRWNVDEPKHFIRTYPDEDQGEDIRKGYDPSKVKPDGAAELPEEEDDDENKDSSRDLGSVAEERDAWRGSP